MATSRHQTKLGSTHQHVEKTISWHQVLTKESAVFICRCVYCKRQARSSKNPNSLMGLCETVFFFFFFWLCPWFAEVHRPGLEPSPQQWQCQILNGWATRELAQGSIFKERGGRGAAGCAISSWMILIGGWGDNGMMAQGLTPSILRLSQSGGYDRAVNRLFPFDGVSGPAEQLRGVDQTLSSVSFREEPTVLWLPYGWCTV